MEREREGMQKREVQQKGRRRNSGRGGIIEEGFIKKPRQTVVVAFWGKMATHMLIF